VVLGQREATTKEGTMSEQQQLDLTDEAADVDPVNDYSISAEMLTHLIVNYGQEWKAKGKPPRRREP
jgi:hypothetical protein